MLGTSVPNLRDTRPIAPKCTRSAMLLFVTRRPIPAPFLSQPAPLREGIALALGGGFARGYAHLGRAACI